MQRISLWKRRMQSTCLLGTSLENQPLSRKTTFFVRLFPSWRQLTSAYRGGRTSSIMVGVPSQTIQRSSRLLLNHYAIRIFSRNWLSEWVSAGFVKIRVSPYIIKTDFGNIRMHPTMMMVLHTQETLSHNWYMIFSTNTHMHARTHTHTFARAYMLL